MLCDTCIRSSWCWVLYGQVPTEDIRNGRAVCRRWNDPKVVKFEGLPRDECFEAAANRRRRLDKAGLGSL